MQIAAADKSLGAGPDGAGHWPGPRRQAWFAFAMAFLAAVLMVGALFYAAELNAARTLAAMTMQSD